MTAAHSGSGRLPRGIAASAPTGADPAVTARLRDFDLEQLRRDFIEQGAFIYLRDFLAAEITAQLVAAVAALTASVNRNYLPGHKQGGSVTATPSTGWRRVCRSIPLAGPDRLVGTAVGRTLADLSGRGSARLRACISTLGPATISVGTTTHPITPAAATRCCSAWSTSHRVGSTMNCTRVNPAAPGCRARCRFRRAAWCFSTAISCTTASRLWRRAKGVCR